MVCREFTTKYGKVGLLLNDYEYRFDSLSADGEHEFWRCNKKGCSARLWTDSDGNRSNPQVG